MSFNVQSLPAKFAEFNMFITQLGLNNCNPDVICIQETWQLGDESLYNITGYHPPSFKLSNPSTQGGGVGIYVKTGVPYKVLSNISVFNDKVVETIFVEITLPKNKKIIVSSSIYHPNSKHTSLSEKNQFQIFLETLNNIMADISDSGKEVFLLGDFNLDVLKYLENEFVTDYIDNVFTYGLLQVIKRPTRCSLNSATILDHVLTNNNSSVINSCIFANQISDHFPILTFLETVALTSKEHFFYSRDFSEGNLILFKETLLEFDWQNVTNSATTQSSYDAFSSSFLDLYNCHFPSTKKRVNKNIHKVEKWYLHLWFANFKTHKNSTWKRFSGFPLSGC